MGFCGVPKTYSSLCPRVKVPWILTRKAHNCKTQEMDTLKSLSLFITCSEMTVKNVSLKTTASRLPSDVSDARDINQIRHSS